MTDAWMSTVRKLDFVMHHWALSMNKIAILKEYITDDYYYLIMRHGIEYGVENLTYDGDGTFVAGIKKIVNSNDDVRV